MKPTATAPIARPSGFSSAMPLARRAPCLTSSPLGVASLTVEPARPTRDFTESTRSEIESFARALTSVL